jgi:hypothetical protein
MFGKIKNFFKKAWEWAEALWEKHDEMMEEMVTAVLPMVIDVAFRTDLSGDQKKKAIVDAIIDNAQVSADNVSHSLLNEAVEVAAAKYNIQIGKLTLDKMNASREAALQAARDFANKKLKISGTEAEAAGVNAAVVLTNADVDKN